MSKPECKLCGLNGPLIEAHIIPKWAFKYLYPEDIEERKQPLVLVSKEKPKRRPIGPYDPNILCSECDNFLGVYDSYGKDVLLDSPLNERGEMAYAVPDVDFEKLRTFLVSVVWRASLSTREEFEDVLLGPYQDRIKEILLAIKAGRTHSSLKEYSFVITKFDEGDLPVDVVNKNIQTPHTRKIDGINMVVLYMPRGLKVFLKTDQRDFNGALKKFSDYTQEGLLIARLGDYSQSVEFKQLLNIA